MKKFLVTASVIVFGAMWMGLGPAAGQETKGAAEKAKDKTEAGAEKAWDKTKETGEKAKDKAVETKDKISAKMNKSGSADVRAAQEALKDKGFDPGPADGLMGPKTRAAIKDFQSKEGLEPTGRMDSDTTAKLGVEKTSSTEGTPSASPRTQKP